MGKRKLPFGYAMEKGNVKAAPKESDCVMWIYSTYHAGASLQEIASELNDRASVHYNTGKQWNKNMIDRILQDQRYSGDALYPELVPEALFNAGERNDVASQNRQRRRK